MKNYFRIVPIAFLFLIVGCAGSSKYTNRLKANAMKKGMTIHVFWKSKDSLW